MKQKVLSVLLSVAMFGNMIMPAASVHAQVSELSERKAGIHADYYRVDQADLSLEEKVSEDTVEQINYPLGDNNLGNILKEKTGSSNYAGARYTAKLVVPETADYTFYTFSDNGSKLMLDGEVVIDYWRVSWEEEQTSKPIHLEAGKEYDFQFDYMKWTGGQCATVSWSNNASVSKQIIPASAFLQPDEVEEKEKSPVKKSQGLLGEYYILADPSTLGRDGNVVGFGEFKSARVDEKIDFGDMETVLNTQIGQKDRGGVRWTGYLTAPETGYYKFSLYSDNGAKLSLDGKQVLTWWVKEWDHWQESKEVYLEKGELYPFKYDYFEWDGGSHTSLYWSFRSENENGFSEKEVIPMEAFSLPEDYEGPLVTELDSKEANLVYEKGISGTLKIKGSGFDKSAEDLSVELLNSTGACMAKRQYLEIVKAEENEITVSVPEGLRVGRYKLSVTVNHVTVTAPEGFQVVTENDNYNDRPEYPNPEWARKDNWQSLNGWWDFSFDPGEIGVKDKWFENGNKRFEEQINVPFCWESEYSGIANTDYRGVAWYQKEITLDAERWKNQELVLKFGAVDWKCSLWVNGIKVGDHEGGYTAFEMNITDYVELGAANTITLMVEDKSSYGDDSYPALVGKQGWNAPCGYTHTSGIWQSVYLEGRKSSTSLVYAHANSDVDNSSVGFDLKISSEHEKEVTVAYHFESTLYDAENEETVSTGSVIDGEQKISIIQGENDYTLDTIKIENQKLWNYNEANLYEGTITISDSEGIVLDQVDTYFGQRKVSTEYYTDKVGAKYIYVNNNPVYLGGLLDQGYWPEGTYTAPSEAALKYDIETMKKLGFNMIRKHLKIEDPLQYYWADKLGMFVWQDMPHATAMCPAYNGAVTPGRDVYEYALENMLNKEYNHPCIIAVMLFNETWGLQATYFNGDRVYDKNDKGVNTYQWVNQMYALAKGINPNILVEDMSPCNRDHIQPSDMNTFHMYPKGYSSSKNEVNTVVENSYTGSSFNYKSGFTNDGDPLLNSEYGGVAAYDGDWDVSWCFKYQTDIQRQYDKLSGFVYTEPYDVEYERNGFMTYDRRDKVFGYEDIAYGGDMTVRDLTGDYYVGIDVDPAKVVAPGTQYSAPVITMRWTPEELEGQYQVKWRFDATDVYGNAISTGIQNHFSIQFKPYERETNSIHFEIPDQECVGTITVWVEAPNGETVCKNFVNVIVSDGKTNTGIESIDTDTYVLRAENNKAEVVKTGEVSFTYELPEDFDVNSLKNLRLIAEASSYKGATANNSASAQTTKGSELPSDMTVLVNGVEIDTVYLPDNPRDIRGTLTLPQGLNGGSSAGDFGYLVNLKITEEKLSAIKETMKDNTSFTVTYQVKEDAKNPNGLRIYNDGNGRYAVNPMVIINPEDVYDDAEVLVNSETKTLVSNPENNNYSVEATLVNDTESILVRYEKESQSGYEIALSNEGNAVVLKTVNGMVLGKSEELETDSHVIKVTVFDDHIKVFADNMPEAVIDVYDYSGISGEIALKAAGNTVFENVTVSPETYEAVRVSGQADVEYVDHFNVVNGQNTFAKRYTAMGDDLVTEIKNGKLEVSTNMGDKLILNDIVAEDMVLEADVSVTEQNGNGNLGFVFRADNFELGADGADGYYAGYGIGDNGMAFVQLGKLNITGERPWTELGRKELGEGNFGEVIRLRVTAIGSRIRIYINDEATPAIDVYDTSYTSGQIALRGFKCEGSYDNLVCACAPRYEADFNNERMDEWTLGGEWNLADGKAATSSENAFAVVGNDSWSDYETSVTVRISKDSVAGILARTVRNKGINAGYQILLDEAADKVILKLVKADGKEKILKESACDIDVDKAYAVGVRVANSTLCVDINGKTVILEGNNAQIKGKAGLINVKGFAVFDNFKVKDKFIYEEDFSEGCLEGWNIIAGDFQVNDNTLYIPKGNGLKMVDGYATWDNYILSGKIKLEADGDRKSNAGFIFRASDFGGGQDDQRGYVCGVNYNANKNATDDASGIELGDIHYGWRQINNMKQNTENEHWYDFEVRAIGNEISVYLDGSHVFTETDEAYRYGMFGIRNFQTAAYMQSVKVVPYELWATEPENPGDGGNTEVDVPTDPESPGDGGNTEVDVPTDPESPGSGGNTEVKVPELPAESDKETENPVVLPAKNEVIKEAGASYRITKSDTENGTVSFKAPVRTTKKTLTVPSVIKVNGVCYKVTNISRNALKSCGKLEKVVIGSNIKTISAKAFSGAKNVKVIALKSTAITSIDKTAFDGINKKATIKVPAKMYDKYVLLLKKCKLPKTVKIVKY